MAVGTAFQGAAAIDPLILVAVNEQEMGFDLNGDGDLFDEVLHQFNTVQGTVTNLGLAVAGPVLVSDRHFAFLIGEASQNGIDLNADGDTGDAVWFVYDPSRPLSPGLNPANTRLATPSNGLAGIGTRGGFVLLQSEAASKADLNGDGDMADIVPRVFDGAAFAVSGVMVPPWAMNTPLRARNARVLVASSEVAAGAFLNGDADMTDTVLGCVDFTQGFGMYVRIGSGLQRSIANHPYALTDGAAVYFVDEATEGAGDLNNDGDTMDAIPAIFDLATGAGENFPMTPLIPAFTVAGAPALGIGAGPNRIILGVSEAAQGARDINNDFDTNDVILAWINPASPTVLNLLPTVVLGGTTPVIDGPRGLVTVSEQGSSFAGTDLNGDGDTSDSVAFVLDATATPGTVTNLGIAVTGFAAQGDDALLSISEIADKNIDRNGNGIVGDIVQAYCDLAAPPSAIRSLAIVSSGQTFFRLSSQELRLATFLQEGQSPTYNDLNRDGDVTDLGLELIALNPTAIPAAILAPTPFFAGTHSLGAAPPLRVGTATFAFATSEAMAGQDLNGDGDLADTVLQYATIQ